MGAPLGRYYSLLGKYLRPLKKDFSLLATLILGSTVIQIINPQVIRFYIDSAERQSPIEVMKVAALLYILIASMSLLVAVTSTYVSQRIAWVSTNNLRSDLLTHMLTLDMSYHNSHNTGDLIERVDGDVNALSNFFSSMVLMVISNLILVVGVILVIFLENAIMGLVFAVFPVVGIAVTYKARKFVVPYLEKMRQKTAELMGFIEEHLQGTEDIRALDMTHHVVRKQQQYEKERMDTIIRGIRISILSNELFNGMISFGTVLVFAVGIPLYDRGGLSLGSLFMIDYYVYLLVTPISVILRQLQSLQSADASIGRIEKILSIQPSIVDHGEEEFPLHPPSVEFERVTFSYDGNREVLTDVSFVLPAGKTLGVVGRTGSGKTTISRLLYRFYEPKEGEIYIARRPIREYPLKSLRAGIGVVTQEVQIFKASIRTNITVFDEGIGQERVWEVLEEVGLDDWVRKLPEGIDTEISEGDVSAGQAQLISIARIFLRSPKIIILDEASSRLDPMTEEAIGRAIRRLLKGRTAIIIAHRMSTLRKVDYILVIGDGKVIEYGERRKLEGDDSSEFAELLRANMEVVTT